MTALGHLWVTEPSRRRDRVRGMRAGAVIWPIAAAMPPWASSVLPPPPLSLRDHGDVAAPGQSDRDRETGDPRTDNQDVERVVVGACNSLAPAGLTDRDHPLDGLAGAPGERFRVDLYFVDAVAQAIQQPRRCGHLHETALRAWGHGLEVAFGLAFRNW